VLKVQALQRRLILKTEEVVEKGILIQVGGKRGEGSLRGW
jgi:hypothetical protein